MIFCVEKYFYCFHYRYYCCLAKAILVFKRMDRIGLGRYGTKEWKTKWGRGKSGKIGLHGDGESGHEKTTKWYRRRG